MRRSTTPVTRSQTIGLLTLSYDNPGILIRQILKKFDQLPHLHRDLTLKRSPGLATSAHENDNYQSLRILYKQRVVTPPLRALALPSACAEQPWSIRS
jgi:hypothetical protein